VEGADIYTMVAARAVQGIGIAFFPIVFGIVREQFPKEKLPIAQGTLISMFAFGGVIGLLAGGTIINEFGWRATFYPIAPIALTLVAIIGKFVKVYDTPAQFAGVSFGMNTLFRLAGASIGPAVACMFMQTNQIAVGGDMFPSPDSYSLIFLAAAAMALATVAVAIVLRRAAGVSNPEVDLQAAK